MLSSLSSKFHLVGFARKFPFLRIKLLVFMASLYNKKSGGDWLVRGIMVVIKETKYNIANRHMVCFSFVNLINVLPFKSLKTKS